MNSLSKHRIIFITGTDTGVGKTLLTCLLLDHLRNSGLHALAIKPFCSGGRNDVRILRAIQDRELELDEINPFYFREPVAPLVAARKHGRRVRLETLVEYARQVAGRCECLLVEGAGGVLVPLGEGFTVADLIAELTREVVIVAANRLGTVNHTLLTTGYLRSLLCLSQRPLSRPRESLKVALMNHQKRDASSTSNEQVLVELLDPVPLVNIGFLGPKAAHLQGITGNRKKMKKELARLLA